MDIKPHVCQPDGDGSRHRGFTHATFAHQHNQAVFVTGDILDQTRERCVFRRTQGVRCRER